MTIFSDFSTPSPSPTVVALGCFDGVHLGHGAVLAMAVELADRHGLASAVLSFQEPPKNYFSPGSVSLLTTAEEKAAEIEACGIDLLWHVPFDAKISSVSPEDFFFEILLNCLHARHVVCGFNYTFGACARGNVELLETLCEENGIGLTVLPPVVTGDMEVSSSAIRKTITEGRMEDAAAALGRPYSLRASVIDGQKLARRLGFPTVNQIFPDLLTVPRHGVYVSRIQIVGNDSPCFGISNVGTRPTVKGSLLCAETHLFDFDGDLYGREIRVEFLHFLRDEKKFDSLEALTEQIEKDILQAKNKIADYSNVC